MLPSYIARRALWTFKRTLVPPLQKPKESPYIVGPYLKPDYLPREYLTEPIKEKEQDDFNHFIYEPKFVEDDDGSKVELLLTADIEGLGITGQIVHVPHKLAASKLIAMKKAEYNTEFARKWHKFGEKTIKSASTALSPRTIRGLSSDIFELEMSKQVVIQPWHLVVALRRKSVQCTVEAIDKDSMKPIKSEDGSYNYQCTIVINNHERVEVKFNILLKN